MKRFCFYAWLFACLFFSDLYSQSDIQIRSWGQAHGIESAVIYGVFQDKNNLIWICTYNGLFYFDGFRAYKSPILEADGKTPFEGIVDQLVQSSDGRYWLKIVDRLGSYDIYSKVFTPLKTQPVDLLATFQSIGDGLYVIDPFRTFLVDREKLELIPMVFVGEEDELISDRVRISGSSGKYFSFKDSMLVEVHNIGTQGRFREKAQVDSTLAFLIKGGYSKYLVDVNGNTWYLNIWDPYHRTWVVEDSLGRDVTKKLMQPFQAMALHYLTSGPEYSWFLADKGLILWEKDSEKPRYLFEEVPELRDSRLINSFDRDKTNWIWNRQGIHHAHVKPSHFSAFTKSQDGLYSNFILGIYPFDNHRLIIKHDFSDPYFSIFDLNSEKVSIICENELYKKYNLIEYKGVIRHGNPSSWIEKHGNQIHDFFSNNLNKNPISSYFISNRDKYDYAIIPQDGKELSSQLRRISDNKMIFPKVDPLQFADQGDTVWIGTESVGLIALHTPSGKTAQWLFDPNSRAGIPANRVHAVIPVANGNLWLGTGKGLSHFDKNTNSFTTYRTKEGLIDDRIYCMAFDRKGFLWIGTGNGLSRFDTLSKSFSNFTKADGLVNAEYNRNSAMLLPDGRMMMGGMEGIDVFDPEEVMDHTEKPLPLIAHVHCNNKFINLRSTFDFGHEENHFAFYFSANPVWMASTLTYQYKLEGAETDWQSLNNSNVVNYPNLPPGKYSFQVKIANQPEIATYDFTIHQVWYATWWFKLGFMAIGLFLLYLVYRIMLSRRLYRLQQENDIMQLKAEQALSVTKERERIIADLHDDIGATLSSLHIYGDLAGKVWDSQPEKGREMVDKIREQSKELMGRMSDIVWSMKDPKNEKNSLRSRIRNYANELLTPQEIQLTDVIASDLDEQIFQPELRRNLLMVIKEAMNNIAKHSQAKRVRLMLYQKDGQLILKINDNGKGLDQLMVQNGNGMGNMEKRCQQMKGKMTLSSQNGSGTTITCSIPIATFSIVEEKDSP